jgi:hypothetical protein
VDLIDRSSDSEGDAELRFQLTERDCQRECCLVLGCCVARQS